jgi:hypothetical protein
MYGLGAVFGALEAKIAWDGRLLGWIRFRMRWRRVGRCWQRLVWSLEDRKQPNGSLPFLASRVDTLVQSFKDLCPGGYTLEQLLENMSAMSILLSAGLLRVDSTQEQAGEHSV